MLKFTRVKVRHDYLVAVETILEEYNRLNAYAICINVCTIFILIHKEKDINYLLIKWVLDNFVFYLHRMCN